jgi:hypothetical protein
MPVFFAQGRGPARATYRSTDSMERTMAVKTYNAGVKEYRPDLLDPRLHPAGYRHPCLLQGHPATGCAAGGSRRRRGRRVLHGHLDHGMDRSADRPGLLQGPRLSYRRRARRRYLLLRLRGLPDRPVRRRLRGQRADLAGRQRLRFQGPARAAPGGHPLPHRLRQDLRAARPLVSRSSATA